MIERTEYKGNAMIKLMKDENDKYGFTFGKKKAQLIVENYNEILKFAEEE